MPQARLLLPHARNKVHGILPTASGLPLIPIAVDPMGSGSVMRTAPTPRNCFQGQAESAGTQTGHPMGNASPSILTWKGISDIYIIRRVAERHPPDH